MKIFHGKQFDSVLKDLTQKLLSDGKFSPFEEFLNCHKFYLNETAFLPEPTLDLHGCHITSRWRHQSRCRKQSLEGKTKNGEIKLTSQNRFQDFISEVLTVTALMSLSCPGNVCLHIPSRISHN